MLRRVGDFFWHSLRSQTLRLGRREKRPHNRCAGGYRQCWGCRRSCGCGDQKRGRGGLENFTYHVTLRRSICLSWHRRRGSSVRGAKKGFRKEGEKPLLGAFLFTP